MLLLPGHIEIGKPGSPAIRAFSLLFGAHDGPVSTKLNEGNAMRERLLAAEKVKSIEWLDGRLNLLDQRKLAIAARSTAGSRSVLTTSSSIPCSQAAS